jgi:hypothetical protein
MEIRTSSFYSFLNLPWFLVVLFGVEEEELADTWSELLHANTMHWTKSGLDITDLILILSKV